MYLYEYWFPPTVYTFLLLFLLVYIELYLLYYLMTYLRAFVVYLLIVLYLLILNLKMKIKTVNEHLYFRCLLLDISYLTKLRGRINELKTNQSNYYIKNQRCSFAEYSRTTQKYYSNFVIFNHLMCCYQISSTTKISSEPHSVPLCI